MAKKATDVLRHEHEAVLKMLEVAEDIAGELMRGAPVEPEVIAEVLEFFQLFADRCHHGKEEEILFPALKAKGMPVEGGPIGVMLNEHGEGREYVQQMARATEAYRNHDERAGVQWAKAALQYAQLLREHILKENNILFVMADRMLTMEEQERLAEEFDRVEIEKMGVGTHQRLHAMMDRLTREFAAH
jgi:hemerythrin-like domain-containing protein